MEAFPIFGTGTSVARGWNEVTVRIQNSGAEAARGQVEVSLHMYGRSARSYRSTAPFSAGAGGAVFVRVPAVVLPYGDLQVSVHKESGEVVHESRLSSYDPREVTLLDISETPRLRGAVHEAFVSPLFNRAGLSRSSSPPKLSVVSPRFDPATGDPLLPDRAALYGSADAVLLRSDVLVRIVGAELDALAGYVLAGGTLAIAPARPEDLRHSTLVAFAGGSITRQSVSARTLEGFEPDSPSVADPALKFIEPPQRATPEVVETLWGYVGGNLHGSLYGASATYGMGEVHLLAFDPTRKPAVDDPWAQARMIDLTRRAYDRRATQVFRPGSDIEQPSYAGVRKQLDPNESSRWAIGAAALLLCLYAVVAGPLNFSFAGKAGRPLRALRTLPIIAAITFVLIVGIGVAAKGVRGRARHLTLVEAGAGMTKATARRFRGFYASRAKDLTVRTTDASSVVATAVVAESADRSDHLVVDREGARLVDVAALPWQTVVVREDGFVSLGDGIAIVPDGETGVAVVNRTGRALRAAILRPPSGGARYYAHIEDGERVTTSMGLAVGSTVEGRSWEGQVSTPTRAGSLDLHRLTARELRGVLSPDAPGLSEAWEAIEEAAEPADWFPDDIPTLIAQIDGGEGKLSDSGLRLESDRLLVRVVGFGGRP